MEKASFNVFLATIVIGILSFASSSFLILPAVKTAVIGIGVLTAFILYLISRVQKQSVDLPWSPLSAIGALLAVSVAVSCLLSASPMSSLLGKSFEAGAGIFLLVALAAGALSILLVRTRERMVMVYISIVGSFCIVALFHILRFIPGTGFLSLGFFTSVTTTMIGSWYDLGIFVALVFIISLLALEILPLNKRLRGITIAIFVVATLFLVVIGLPVIWLALFLATLCIAVVLFFHRRHHKADASFISKIPLFSAIVCIIVAGFLWHGSTVTVPLANALNAGYGDVSLPWQYTIDIAEPVIKAYPLFGIGPDRFADAYLQLKPEAVNSTQFWNTTFPTGANFVLTSLVTQGLVGFVLWVLLLVFFCIQGVRVLSKKPVNVGSHFSVTASFFGAGFLWLVAIFHAPSHVLLFLTFVMTGLFIAECIHLNTAGARASDAVHAPAGAGKMKVLDWSTGGIERTAAFIGIGIAFLLLATGIILLVKETVSQIYLQDGIETVSNAGSGSDPIIVAAAAKNLFQKATAWHSTDSGYQALASIDDYEVNALVSNANAAPAQSAASTTALATTISSLISEGIGFARQAEALDPSNPSNYIVEANISDTAANLKIPNASDNARLAYDKALRLDPLNPSTYLALAKLDYFEGSTTAAGNDLSNALQIKPDYSDALYEVGVISYDQGDYQTAKEAFIQTLTADGTYADAAYLLSLTLVRLGDTKDAIAELAALLQAYPNNQQLTTLLADLKAGISPFGTASAAPPAFAPSPTASSTSLVASTTAPTKPVTKKR